VKRHQGKTFDELI